MDEILFTGHRFLHSHLISIYFSLIYNGNKLICLQLFIELIYILLYKYTFKTSYATANAKLSTKDMIVT